jgi:Tfp pilus assembly protein PilN
MRFGSIPDIWQAEKPRAALHAYVQLDLREEVRAEALARNLPASAVLPVAGLVHGQVINIAGLARTRDAAAARSTARRYRTTAALS